MPVVKKQRFRKQSKNGSLRKHVDLSSVTFEEPEGQLAASSITIDAGIKSFSFKNNLMDNEFVQNPNILERKDFKQLKNESLKSKDKFDEKDDPFFNLDEGESIVDKQRISRISSKTLSNTTGKSLVRKINSTQSSKSKTIRTGRVK
jgi:hypothetical protein